MKDTYEEIWYHRNIILCINKTFWEQEAFANSRESSWKPVCSSFHKFKVGPACYDCSAFSWLYVISLVSFGLNKWSTPLKMHQLKTNTFCFIDKYEIFAFYARKWRKTMIFWGILLYFQKYDIQEYQFI